MLLLPPAELRDMSKKADAEKAQQEHAVAAMDSIEAAARKQYEADQAAAQAQAGKWVWHEGSGYYYNATHRWAMQRGHYTRNLRGSAVAAGRLSTCMQSGWISVG
jgi:hypothetical protein